MAFNKFSIIPVFLKSSRIFQNELLLRSFSKKIDLGGVASLGKTSKKKIGKLGPMTEKKIMPVVEDPKLLVTYCCGSNYMKEGEDVKLKPDEEYPNWLWDLRIGKLPPLEEMDPESKAYWKRVRKIGMRNNNRLQKLKRF